MQPSSGSPHVLDGAEPPKPECSGGSSGYQGDGVGGVVVYRPFLRLIPKLFLGYVIVDTKAAVLGNTHPWPSL